MLDALRTTVIVLANDVSAKVDQGQLDLTSDVQVLTQLVTAYTEAARPLSSAITMQDLAEAIQKNLSNLR